jgi:FtsZ-binding cell division protein ZapB
VNEHPPNTAAMVRQRKKDSKNKRGAVLSTVEAMERTRSPITVAEVARRAGVSPWLVRQKPLMQEVRNAQQRLSSGAHHAAKDSNTGSLQVERELLRQENQRLRDEKCRYRQRISELLGDQIDGTDAHSQSIRVQELTDQNAALSRQASEATQQVHKLQQQLAALSTDLDAAHAVNRSLMAELNRQERDRART